MADPSLSVTPAFSLCTECAENYRTLRFDPAATYGMSIMPLCCIQWNDEHPFNATRGCIWVGCRRDSCRDSLIRLSNARMALWETGGIPDDLRPLWDEAQQLLPNWPGFQRLSIGQKERKALDGCRQELDEIMGAIRNDFPNTATENKAGGVSTFRAWGRTAPQKKPWWKFW